MRLKFLASIAFLLVSVAPGAAQELFTEMRAQVHPSEPARTFRVLGDRSPSAFSAYGIHIITAEGKEQMLDQFDALLPDGSEIDVLYVEDLNFDGYADLRLVKYLTGGANTPYLYWLHDPQTGEFVSAPEYEVVLSPEIDYQTKQLISRKRSSATEYSTEFFRPGASGLILVRREERTFAPDGSSVLKVFATKSGVLTLVETKNLPPE